jgi:flagellar hook-basal body complex protein FliE
MDGLTIRNSQQLLDTGKTASEIRSSQNAALPAIGGAAGDSKSFADTLKDAVGQVNTLQKESDVKMQQLATGKSDNIQDVMIAADKADIALRLMVQVRNKIVDAYQEVMKMQV